MFIKYTCLLRMFNCIYTHFKIYIHQSSLGKHLGHQQLVQTSQST